VGGPWWLKNMIYHGEKIKREIWWLFVGEKLLLVVMT
jgi:hypothetical protein